MSTGCRVRSFLILAALGGICGVHPVAAQQGLPVPGWSGIGVSPSGRIGHASVYDSGRQRMIVLDGYSLSSYLDDVWTFPLGVRGGWERLVVEGPAPVAREGFSAIYDPLRDRVIIFGGDSPFVSDRYLDDVWALELSGVPHWTRLDPLVPGPYARSNHSAVYDPSSDRMLVYGGFSRCVGCNLPYMWNDIWALDLGSNLRWEEIPADSPPIGRYDHAAIFDGARNRMLVFGGFSQNPRTYDNTAVDETWELSLSGTPAWRFLPPVTSHPSARYAHTAVWDSAGDRMLIFGGIDFAGTSFAETWGLDLSSTAATWSMIPAAGPAGRSGHTAVFDAVGRRMVIFGGASGVGASYQLRNDVWALTLAGSPAWADLSPPESAPPPARRAHAAVYDSLRDRMIITLGEYYDGSALTFYGDTWMLNLSDGTWSSVPAVGPTPRSGFTAVLDRKRDQALIFGGSAGDRVLNDVWALSLSGQPTWTPITASGVPPVPRTEHSAIFDPIRDRMLVYGGYYSDNATHRILGDVWELSLSPSPSWRPLDAVGVAPGPRFYHSAVYDPLRDRMFIVGGADTSGVAGGTWALALNDTLRWSRSTAADPGIWTSGVVYDPDQDALMALAPDGSGLASTMDTWELALGSSSTWLKLATEGTGPTARVFSSMIRDAKRDRLVMFGGYDNVSFDDTWGLDFDAATSALISLVAVAANPGRVRITWSVQPTPAGPLTVQRRRANDTLRTLSQVRPDALGRVAFEDNSVVPGGRYAYTPI